MYRIRLCCLEWEPFIWGFSFWPPENTYIASTSHYGNMKTISQRTLERGRMPVYIRKCPLEIPPPSERNWRTDDDDDEGYYLTDPDQAQDRLPQPFRMIEKLVYQLIEQVWESIKAREEKREAERTRAKHILYQPTTDIQLSGRVNCIAAGGAGRCLFVGLSAGVAVFRLPNYTWICGWETGSVEICTICTTHLGNQTYVLATVDDMGVVRLFYFHKDGLLLVKAINESEDVSKRTICTNIEISQGGDYAGVLLEGAGESWLEVYRLPKDSWQKELEHSQATTSTKSPSAAAPPLRQAAPSQTFPETQATEVPGRVTPALSSDNIKLSPPLFIMKIKPPKPLAGSMFKSPLEAMQKSDDCSVIGSGQNHVISAHQWEQQEAIFCHEFKKYLEVENPETGQDDKPSRAVFHFLLPCEVLQMGGESKAQAGVPNTISVHWSGSHNLFLYLLVRPPKEKTDAEPKPDVVWPCAAPILCSAVSSCSAYLALGFEDGSVTIWDVKYSGFPLAVLALPEENLLQSIYFLEGLVVLEEQALVNTFPASPRVQILTWCTNGSLYLITAVAGKETNMAMLLDSPEDADGLISAVMPVSILPTAALVFFRSGIVKLMDVAQQETVCHFVVPSSYMLSSPWQPVFTVDQENGCLICKGDQRLRACDTEGRDTVACSLFVFSFNAYPFMDSSRKKQELTLAPSLLLPLEKRCQIFLQSRLQSFAENTKQQQDCWKLLQEHTTALQQEKSKRM